MTFTLVAFDPARGTLGVATASRSLAVGRSVPAIDPTVGAVASQAWTNPELRHHMLAALRDGLTADDAVGLIPELDEDAALRQVAVVDRRGHVAAHTGGRTTAWAGHVIGDHCAVLGNVLAGEHVLGAMVNAYEQSAEEGIGAGAESPSSDARAFAGRLLRALRAGEAAGGDSRGRESAALMVTRVRDSSMSPPSLAIDLRVDHHPEPLVPLGTMLDLTDPAG